MTQALTTITALDTTIANVVADRSFGTAAKYRERMQHFAAWLVASGILAIDKTTVAAYRAALVKAGKSASTVNGHLVAVRALLREAADLGYIDDRDADRACRVKGLKEKGTRAGNWLSPDETQALLNLPDRKTIKGKRDRALLGVMIFCGLRRSELATLTIGHLQTRERHNVIADLLGKGGRVRTIPMPSPVRRAVESWLVASGRDLRRDSLVFVAMRRGDCVSSHDALTDDAIYKVVRDYGAMIGHAELAPHDIRRTFAKLANAGGARLEDISAALGHASLVTTQRYLGLGLNLKDGAPSKVGLINGRRVVRM